MKVFMESPTSIKLSRVSWSAGYTFRLNGDTFPKPNEINNCSKEGSERALKFFEYEPPM